MHPTPSPEPIGYDRARRPIWPISGGTAANRPWLEENNVAFPPGSGRVPLGAEQTWDSPLVPASVLYDDQIPAGALQVFIDEWYFGASGSVFPNWLPPIPGGYFPYQNDGDAYVFIPPPPFTPDDDAWLLVPALDTSLLRSGQPWSTDEIVPPPAAPFVPDEDPWPGLFGGSPPGVLTFAQFWASDDDVLVQQPVVGVPALGSNQTAQLYWAHAHLRKRKVWWT